MKICSSLTPASRALARAGSQFLALAEIGGEGDDLAAIVGLQPFQDHAGVEAARIGEDDAIDLLGHGQSCGLNMGNGARLSGARGNRNQRRACSMEHAQRQQPEQVDGERDAAHPHQQQHAHKRAQPRTQISPAQLPIHMQRRHNQRDRHDEAGGQADEAENCQERTSRLMKVSEKVTKTRWS